jgi:hypothetical protein
MRTQWLAALALGAILTAGLISGAASAQSAAAPGAPAAIGSTATGGPPERAGSVTSVGQTKPGGAAVGDDLGTRPDLQEKSRKLDRQINQGICNGCK